MCVSMCVSVRGFVCELGLYLTPETTLKQMTQQLLVVQPLG